MEPKAWTASGDGSSRKGASFSSRFATYPPVPFHQDITGVMPGVPFRQFLASTREVNHKTSTQFENWLTLFDDIAAVHNESPSGSKNPITSNEIIRKVTGYSADHAADQKKLAKELFTRKREEVMIFRGIEAMASKPAEEVEGVLSDKFAEMLEDVGGSEGWGKLSMESQLQWVEGVIKDVRHHFGELDFANLPESQRRIELLFFWSGCAMHKDLNTFKAGAVALSKFWKEAGLDGPVKLLSRGQEKELSSQGQEKGPLADADEAEDCSDNVAGGAVKLTSLIGALVKNKDETKGCAEEFRVYTQDRLGHAVAFPDTSNIRYQCYGDAAVEIIRHPELYVDFVDQHGLKKKRGAGPNHMEQNILKGLVDPPTMTEMAVLTLYHESISKPYAMQVHGSINEWKNALDLGPLHDDIEDHCDAIVDNPDLLIGDHVSHATGAFYGTQWDQAVVDHILSTRDQLPHLRDALVAFLKGAREGWRVFTEEFEPDSEISRATAEERALGFRPPTNDHSEGGCAMDKYWGRRAPTMTTHQRNARIQVQCNGPSFLEFCHDLPESDLGFTRRKGRRLDAGKRSLRESQAQAAADLEAVEEERRNTERRARRKEERQAKAAEMVEGFEPILDLDVFRSLPAAEPTNKFLQRQLVWLRVVGHDEGLPAGLFTSTKKERMKELVIEALERRGQVIAAGADGVVSENLVDNQMDTDAALVSDDSEVELELVDKVGLGPNKDTRSSPLDLTPSLPSTPGSPSLSTSTPPIYRFGCRWDSVDFSCPYDCVFMTFAWIYFHAPHTWRTTWA